jgi:hypothetical protein
MASIDILLANLLSPVVLAFVLGIFASVVKSDLEFPRPLYDALSIYLLLAIGLKGGAELSATPFGEFALPALATLALGIVTPITAYNVLRRLGKMDRVNSAALAAHYGSVSAVTFIVAIAFGTLAGFEAEGFMPALVAILEVPAIIVALMIGLAAGKEGMEGVAPFFVGGFKGALTLFLLEMGLVTARRLRDLKEVGLFLVGFGVIVPILHGALGTWAGIASGLSVGGAAVLGAMVSSASYIAAPAAVRIALPEANPTFYLTAALGITFPFNLTLGIPLYFTIAEWLA